ncbi:toxin-antitoxin system HicB family antitoxin [Brachybacterium paraconglomeratum]
MVTKPSSRYAPRPDPNAPTTGSAKDAFISPSPQAAGEMSKLTIRLLKSMHKDVKAAALAEDVSVQEWIQEAINQKLASKPAS